MHSRNPPPCGVEIVLPEGAARCEFPRDHVGPHRASGPPHLPRPGATVYWSAGGPAGARAPEDAPPNAA